MSEQAFPRLRALEVQQSRTRPNAYDLWDPSGLAPSRFTVSPDTLSILARLNGRHDLPHIQADFLRRMQRPLYSDEIGALVQQLDEALFLEGPRFEAHFEGLQQAYRKSSTRPLRDPESLGAPVDRLALYLDTLIGSEKASEANGTIVGIVAPHLDYERGAPCYSAAYQDLARRTQAELFVILGTNHFGRSNSVVGTCKDFETPFGTVPHDADFMNRMNQHSGVDLCEGEYDHVAEHSIELQVVLLKHQMPDRAFRIAPYLCPDPNLSPDSAADLDRFVDALKAVLEETSTPICLIAGADLSHVGRYFQDDRDLDDPNLLTVERLDREALEQVARGDALAFKKAVGDRCNDTNICSVGCIYALTAALQGRGQPKLLTYHQALTKELENCVTSSAMEFEARS